MAKKDWELSHLLSLREENEEVEEEEEVDGDHLTYDRPDQHNKVTLRRSATGLWQVCSSGHKDDLIKETKDHRVRRKRCKHENSAKQAENHIEYAEPSSLNNHLHSESELSSAREENEDGSDLSLRKRMHSARILTSVSIPIAPDVLSAMRARNNSVDGDGCIGDRTRRKNQNEPKVLVSRLNNSTSSSPQNSSVLTRSNNSMSPTNHKYQTRLKVLNDS